MSLLSVIIPFSGGYGDSVSIGKLKQTINTLTGLSDVEILIFDTGSVDHTSLLPFLFPKINIRYIHRHDIGEANPGVIRNCAVEEAVGRYILLLSEGQWLSRRLVKDLPKNIHQLENQGGHAFKLYPSLHLQSSYAEAIEATDSLSTELYSDTLSSYLHGNRDKVKYLSLSTGVILARRHWFAVMGGFRKEFNHYEWGVLDLIHRLAAYFPVGKKPEDYAVDVSSQFVAGYLGYRRYYSFYVLPNLFNEQFILQHGTDDSDDVSSNHHEDAEKFASILASGPAGCRSLNLDLSTIKASSELGRKMLQRPFDSSKEIPTLPDYIRELITSHDTDMKDCHGLFQLEPQDKLSPSGFRNKLRRLYLSPLRFLNRYISQNKADA